MVLRQCPASYRRCSISDHAALLDIARNKSKVHKRETSELPWSMFMAYETIVCRETVIRGFIVEWYDTTNVWHSK